jgi:hypothetical protein
LNELLREHRADRELLAETGSARSPFARLSSPVPTIPVPPPPQNHWTMTGEPNMREQEKAEGGCGHAGYPP